MWPGLTVKAIAKYYPETDETPKGHMKGQRQGLRSTKTRMKQETSPAIPTTKEKVSVPPKKKTLEMFAKVVDLKEVMYSD